MFLRPAIRALTKVSISSNNLRAGAQGGKVLAEAIKNNKTRQEVHIASKYRIRRGAWY